MSYIRAGHEMKYVEGESEDYIFPSCGYDGEVEYIEDYGSISDKGIVECLARILYRKNQDIKWNDYLIKHLAERLKVKLKEKNYGEWEL